MAPMTPKRLLEVRLALGLSQEVMGRLVGASFASVNRWEGGHSTPTGGVLDIYQAISAALSRHKGAKVGSTFLASDHRGVFLYALFSMAYGPARRKGESNAAVSG
jgi:transcriptional regulator with XRE-family HTH domain